MRRTLFLSSIFCLCAAAQSTPQTPPLTSLFMLSGCDYSLSATGDTCRSVHTTTWGADFIQDSYYSRSFIKSDYNTGAFSSDTGPTQGRPGTPAGMQNTCPPGACGPTDELAPMFKNFRYTTEDWHYKIPVMASGIYNVIFFIADNGRTLNGTGTPAPGNRVMTILINGVHHATLVNGLPGSPLTNGNEGELIDSVNLDPVAIAGTTTHVVGPDTYYDAVPFYLTLPNINIPLGFIDITIITESSDKNNYPAFINGIGLVQTGTYTTKTLGACQTLANPPDAVTLYTIPSGGLTTSQLPCFRYTGDNYFFLNCNGAHISNSLASLLYRDQSNDNFWNMPTPGQAKQLVLVSGPVDNDVQIGNCVFDNTQAFYQFADPNLFPTPYVMPEAITTGYNPDGGSPYVHGGTVLYNNTILSGGLNLVNTIGFTMYGNRFSNAQLTIGVYNSKLGSIENNTWDLFPLATKLSAGVGPRQFYGLSIVNSDQIGIWYNTHAITGPLFRPPVDAMVIMVDSHGTRYNSNYRFNNTVWGNTTGDTTFNAGLEIAGRSTYLGVHQNNFYKHWNACIGGYYGLSVDHMDAADNVCSQAPALYAFNYAISGSFYNTIPCAFTNNHFTTSTLLSRDVSFLSGNQPNANSSWELDINHFSLAHDPVTCTVTGNTVTNNNFLLGGISQGLHFSPAAGFSGTGNICPSVNQFPSVGFPISTCTP